MLAAALVLTGCAAPGVRADAGERGFGDALREEVERDLGAGRVPGASGPHGAIETGGEAGPGAPVPSAVDDVFMLAVRERARLDPQFATLAGLHQHDGRLTRYDDASHAARAALAASALRVTEALLDGPLSPGEREDALLLLSQFAVQVHEGRRVDARTVRPDLPLGAVFAVNDLLIGDFAPRDERMRHAVERLLGLPGVCAEIQTTLERPPALWTRMAIDDTKGALAFLDEVPGLAGGELPPELEAALADALPAARGALVRYATFLEDEVLPRSDGDWALGREEFEYRLRVGYLTDLDADALLAFGRREFTATLRELDAVARAIEPGRDWRQLLAEMMEQHPTEAGLMPAYRDEVARARAFLVQHGVVPIPDETLQVLETPAFMRSTVPFAAYSAPAPLDASRLGTFYVTPVAQAHILSDIPGTTWHEAYPGHHLQLVYAKQHPSLVRRLNESPLLSEGWGLYCEELAAETGYYDDPRERLMQLNWKLQRAARVILDTSLHAFGMRYEDAVAFLMDEVGMLRDQAEASVNAYTQQPTYFSSYLLGMREIVRIREACRARLGARFSLGEFHERLLRCGNVPPALVEVELQREWR